MQLTQKIVTAVATGAIVFNAFATVAFADTTIQITGNGSDSYNKANVDTNTSTNVTQSNNSTITNNVSATADTGNNKAKDNTGGGVSINTGDATVNTTVSNSGNVNKADVSCGCNTGSTNVTISGNGSDSTNKVDLDSSNNTNVTQTNTSDITNNVDAKAKTGDNSAKDNTGGDVSINTGSATTSVQVTNAGNVNTAKVGDSGQGGALSLKILDNGSDTYNKIDLGLNNSASVQQWNTSDISNDVYAKADTGDNYAKDNTGGDVSIDTGDANSTVGVDNMVNFNWADINCGCLMDDVLAKVAGNGTDSTNKIYADLGGDNSLLQANEGPLNNDVNSKAKSGDNGAKDNTGTVQNDPSIDTGNADNTTNVNNSGNVNVDGGTPSSDWPNVDFNFNVSLTLSQLLALFGSH